MPISKIVTNQKVNREKMQRTRELRHRMTEEERILWERLRDRQLNGLRFRRQQVIDGFIVDFYCHAAGLIVEVDGPVHDRQAEYDTERDRVLSARGLRIVRVRNEDVKKDVTGVLARIANVVWEKKEGDHGTDDTV